MALEPLTETEKRKIIRANILADSLLRLVQWVAFLAILGALIVPLAWAAWSKAGPITACVVLALGVACAWHVTPHGRSYAAQVRDIEARHKPHE